MTDLQNRQEDYLFPIDHVGICKVQHPILVCSKMEPKTQTSVATITLTTSLPRETFSTRPEKS
ncbi:GTP cyclohydrolase, FolE2/MptA family [Paenibacillus farraposensis]|uniref:GTP cyclohydrolase, FolE2/MptA family n=1 Tax=Paenibacillus farraposensis TaxID=2807095 RepID=A0ABW4DDF1_9BACL|nr:GTP cyclohydrolase, FolE2/MptA family [Paenibacillus farraposensis]MCC3381544.1 GTP cyclohydrolase I FolE2 [Paenibacillus farraposensis]